MAASLATFGWGLALGFSLAVVVLVSLLVVATFPKEALSLTTDASHCRAFKGAEATTNLSIGSNRGTALSEFDLAFIPEGLEVTVSGEGARRTLGVKSKFAGVYGGLKVRVGITDPLGVFARSEIHELPVRFEFLPISLLAAGVPLRVAPAMLGDFPAGRSGFGQEFYSAETYTSARSSRDIMWKRQARMPTDHLMVRVGEANIPERLTVCLLERRSLAERRSPRWMDLALEAMARVGLPVVSSGVTLRVLHVLGEGTTVSEARDTEQLASLLVSLWNDEADKATTEVRLSQADIMIVSEVETQAPDTMGLVLSKPSVILGWGRRRVLGGSSVVFFSGHEDVSALVARVLSK